MSWAYFQETVSLLTAVTSIPVCSQARDGRAAAEGTSDGAAAAGGLSCGGCQQNPEGGEVSPPLLAFSPVLLHAVCSVACTRISAALCRPSGAGADTWGALCPQVFLFVSLPCRCSCPTNDCCHAFSLLRLPATAMHTGPACCIH